MVMGEYKGWGGIRDKKSGGVIHRVCFQIFSPVTVNDPPESNNPGPARAASCSKNTMRKSGYGTIIPGAGSKTSSDNNRDQYRSDSDNDPGDGTVGDLSCFLPRFVKGENTNGDCHDGKGGCQDYPGEDPAEDA